MKKIKVLQVGGVASFGGIETFQFSLFKNIDREKYCFDFLINNTDNKLVYENDIKELGGKVFYIPSRRQNYLKRIIFFKQILKNNEYDIIHVNYSALVDDLFLSEAIKTDARVILHSHSSNFTDSKFWYWVHIYNRNKYLNLNIVRLACSVDAGKWMHCNSLKQNDFTVINNGIDIDSFRFNLNERNELRKKLNVDENTKIIGHIGRFSKEKNHLYIIDIVSEIIKKNKNIKLMLVGDGKLRKEIEEKIKQKSLKEYVLLLGVRQDIANLLSVMDVFLFPSLHEGLGISILEAQASGLKCYISDSIPKEVDLTDLIYRKSINCSPKNWADLIISDTEKIDREKYI